MLTSQAVLTIIVFGAILITLCCILKSPFKYPYFVYQFDVSGKRNVHIEDIVDMKHWKILVFNALCGNTIAKSNEI